MTIGLVIAGIILCIILSGFFSGSEMAFSSCNLLRLENEKDDGSKKAAVALFVAEHFNDALSAILIGNNLVNIACSSLGTVAVILVMGSDAYSWVSTLIITIAVIIFGETIPKISVKKSANTYAKKYAYPVSALMLIFKPLVLLVTWLVHLIMIPIKGDIPADTDEAVEELQSIIETAEDEDVLEEDQSELVRAAIDFPDVAASEVMTARVDVIAIDIDDTYEENLRIIEHSNVTRIPVYQDSIDHVIGILHLNHFLKAMTENEQVDIRALLLEPCYVYKTLRLPEVLAELRKTRQHLAIVVDEYGGMLGVVTMEDVLEAVVGDIWDETDTIEDEIVKNTENEYEIDGDMVITDLLELMNIREDDFEGESETAGGWTIEMLEHFPVVGEGFRYESFMITVLAMDGRRVERLKIEKIPLKDE